MNKQEILKKLETFSERLINEVSNAYKNRGHNFGHQRFSTWTTQFIKFLDENLPNAATEAKTIPKSLYPPRIHQTDYDFFWNQYGNPFKAFIDSLILDIENDEFDFSVSPESSTPQNSRKPSTKNKRVFIVHGHDDLTTIRIENFIRKLGFEAVILHEKANKGMTIIEKIESYTDVGFAIILYTEDDTGNTKSEADKGKLNPRARQNVVFEHGYLIAKLTRQHVIPLVMSNNIELPSDISGVVYINNADWKQKIAQEMKSVGYTIDFNKLLD